MTPREIRLKLLELTRPSTSSPDATAWIARAMALEAWINGAGQGESPRQEPMKLQQPQKPGQPQGPAHRK